MKRRYKILIGIGAVLTMGIGTLMGVTAYDSPCPADIPADAGAAAGADSMRAIYKRCYGVPQAANLKRVPKPVPGDGQVLIKVHASSVNPAQWYDVSGQPLLMRLSSGIGAPDEPAVGVDVAGVIEAVGPNVKRFKVGDAVFGGAKGAYAEYALGRDQGSLTHKPDALSFEEAAGIPIAGITALQGLRDHGKLKAGQKVLINGASGGVGIYAVQIAKAMGAEVTGVCSTRNVEMVKSLGADFVIDYTRANFTEGEQRYDLILDNVGNHSYFDLADVTTPEGIIVTVGGQKADPWMGPIWRVTGRAAVSPFIKQEMPFYIAKMNKEDMGYLADLAQQGKLRTVIDRTFPLEQAGAALEYLGGGHARGKVIVTVR